MSSTLQVSIAFPIVFAFSVGLVCAAPKMYAETAALAELRYEYIYEQKSNVRIYATGSIDIDCNTSETVYTSPERMQCLINSIRDSVELIAGGVKSIC